jgi:hypothetical protein
LPDSFEPKRCIPEILGRGITVCKICDEEFVDIKANNAAREEYFKQLDETRAIKADLRKQDHEASKEITN